MMPTLPFVRSDSPAAAVDTGKASPPAAACAHSPGFDDLSFTSQAADLAAVAAPALDGRESQAERCRRPDNSASFAGVRNEERNYIAQQLHDDLGGVLTGLKACIAVVIERRSAAGFAPDPLLVDASALAQLAFETVRRIAVNLRPPILEQTDLWSALEWQVAQLARRTHISVDYFVDPALTSIPFGAGRGTLVYRLICEALTNVEKHAHASRVSVRLLEAGDVLTVTVADNGLGLKRDRIPGERTHGISGMKERAEEYGGELVVTSNGDIGTMVRLSMPLGRRDGN